MAETLYLNDGTMEVVLEEKDIFLEKLLRNKLGEDAARFFRSYIAEMLDDAEYAEEALQDAEKTADDYLALCHGAVGAFSELKELVHEERLNKAKIQKIVDGAYANLCRNL